jgi:hypothetical protein
LNVKPGIQGWVLNENVNQKYPLSKLFLGAKFCKNLEFFLSEHCE